MKFKIAILCLLVALTGIIILSCSGESSPQDSYKIAVIAKSTVSDFWQNVQRGVKAAATEYNIEISFDGPENEEDYVAQNEMITSSVARGVDAIVLSAIDYYESVDAVNAAVAAGVKVVMIDSGVDSDKISSFIGTDNYEAGRLAGEAALDAVIKMHNGDDSNAESITDSSAESITDSKADSKSESKADSVADTELNGGDVTKSNDISNNDGGDIDYSKIIIGIVNYDPNSANGQEREAGLRAVAEENGATVAGVVNVDSNIESATAGALELLNEHPEINAIVGFNEWTTLGVGYAVEQLGLADTVAAVGFDSNVVSIGMLETGEMDALIVQNPFAIGYIGVQTAYELLNNGEVDETILTSATVVTRENMFSESIQRILFRFD